MPRIFTNVSKNIVRSSFADYLSIKTMIELKTIKTEIFSNRLVKRKDHLVYVIMG